MSDRELTRAFLAWLKKRIGCEKCGRKPPFEITFHHSVEERRGGRTISQMGTPTALMKELLKGEFLCQRCHKIAEMELRFWDKRGEADTVEAGAKDVSGSDPYFVDPVQTRFYEPPED